MAQNIPTYQQQEIKTPTPTRGPVPLGGTVKLSGQDHIASALGQVGGALQDVGKVVKAFDDKRTEIKNDGDMANFSVNYLQFASSVDADIKSEQMDGKIKLEDVSAEYNKRVSDKVSKFISDSDYNDDVKRWAENQFMVSHGENMVKLNSWTRARQTERDIVNIEMGMVSAINGGNLDLADQMKEQLGRHTTPEKAQASYDKAYSSFQNNVMKSDIAVNPDHALQILKEQERTGEKFYDVSDEALKSGKAYAKQLLTERSNETIDEIYKPDSAYEQLPIEQKLDWLDDKRDMGWLSASAYKSERKRVMEPEEVEMTPELNEKYLELQSEIHAARGNRTKMADALNRVTATPMPKERRTSLYNEARQVEDPTSVFNSTAARMGRDLIASYFKEHKDLGVELIDVWYPWREDVPGFKAEDRVDMLTRMESEAQMELSSWLYSQHPMPSAEAINSKAYEILQKVTQTESVRKLAEQMVDIRLDPLGAMDEAIEEQETQQMAGQTNQAPGELTMDDIFAEVGLTQEAE